MCVFQFGVFIYNFDDFLAVYIRVKIVTPPDLHTSLMREDCDTTLLIIIIMIYSIYIALYNALL